MICWKNLEAYCGVSLNISQRVLLLLHDVVEQLTVGTVLHHQEQVLFSLNDLVKLDDVGMPHHLEDVDLSGDSFDIRNIHYLAFL